MKVLSLLQPWASLVVLGHKKIETRSWDTKHRGPLLIHASLSRKQSQKLVFERPFCDAIALPWNLPFGAIIGMVNVWDVRSTDLIILEHAQMRNQQMEIDQSTVPSYDHPSLIEEAFGDYSPGRYGWLLSDPVLFDEPIPAKGMLGLWNYEGELPKDFKP